MSLLRGFALTCFGGFSAFLGLAFVADAYSYGKNVMSKAKGTRNKLESGLLVFCTSTLGGLIALVLLRNSFECIEEVTSMINKE